MVEQNSSAPQQTPGLGQANTVPQDPLKGVGGWLQFFVVVNMYVGPILVGLQYLAALIGFAMLFEKYPGLLVVGLIEMAAGGFLVWKWIMLARGLRDIKPQAVQQVRLWLKISLAWTILSTPLSFLSGMPAEALLPDAVKGVVLGLISFFIWYTYFNVSKRVKATYPDWNP